MRRIVLHLPTSFPWLRTWRQLARSPAGMRRKHAVVEHEVDPRPWGERGQLLEQRERLEHELARAVRPRGLEREHDAAIGQEPEPVLGHCRAEIGARTGPDTFGTLPIRGVVRRRAA